MVPKSSWAEVTPKMTEVRLLSISLNWPWVASFKTRWAMISASSCAESVAGTILGGTPQERASNGTLSMNAPRVA